MRFRDHASSIIVATLSVAFGVTLLQITENLTRIINSNGATAESSTVQMLVTVTSLIFIVIAAYVGAIVTANTFATIIAGRVRTIALMRLVGSTARTERARVAREGVIVGLIGAALGLLLGTALTFVMVESARAMDVVPDINYGYVLPILLLPAGIVVLTTWLASWVGSRRVLSVSPMQATGGAIELSAEEVRGNRLRVVSASILAGVGVLMIIAGAVIGQESAEGVLIALPGGIISFTGVLIGASAIMPALLRLIGRLFGRGAAARLASENAVRYPERSTRTTIGLVIGVAVVSMFAVASATFDEILNLTLAADPALKAEIKPVLDAITAIFTVLVGFSALLAAIGMVNNLSLSVMQRTRELGLLRALGFTARQLRQMIQIEAAQLTAAAMVLGLALGIFYGWAGAQSMLGSGIPHMMWPVVPAWLVVAIVGASLVLTLTASLAPARRATRIAPVEALAVE